MTRETGGSAFPHQHNMLVATDNGELKTFGEEGLTIRDWFAGMALQGQLSNPYAMEVLNNYINQNTNMYDVAASASYNFADAMLKARKA